MYFVLSWRVRSEPVHGDFFSGLFVCVVFVLSFGCPFTPAGGARRPTAYGAPRGGGHDLSAYCIHLASGSGYFVLRSFVGL